MMLILYGQFRSWNLSFQVLACVPAAFVGGLGLLLLTGQPIDAQRAYQIGLVNRVVPRGEALRAGVELAEKITRNGPLAVRTAKEIAVRSLGQEAGFVLEKSLGARVFESEDAKEGPRAFAEKRPPRFWSLRKSAHRMRKKLVEEYEGEGE